MSSHFATPRITEASPTTDPSASSDIDNAQGPTLDRRSLFAQAKERSESHRFLSGEGVSASEVSRRGHVADTAGLTKDDRLGGTATFGHDSAAIRPQTVQMLNELLPELQAAAREGHTIALDGHASTVGSEAHNQRLSQRRAEAIRDYLVKAGIPKEQIEIKAHGESNPAVKEIRKRDEAINRRVEISVERKASPQPEAPRAAPTAEIPVPAPAVAPVVPPPPPSQPELKPQEPQPLMRQDASNWPLFDQPRLSGILAQPKPDSTGLRVDTVLRPDFQDFLSGAGVKQGPYVDFSHGGQIGEMLSTRASGGISTNSSAPSAYFAPTGASAPGTEPDRLLQGTSNAAIDNGAPGGDISKPIGGASPLLKSQAPSPASSAQATGEQRFWRDTSEPATPVDVPRLRITK